ncbi:MAG: CDP-alcohol phosphatidyltransferase family protein [Bacteroidota bacterium]
MKLKLKHLLADLKEIPNLLSLFRLMLVIPFYFVLIRLHEDNEYRVITIGLIFVAFITDILDGYVARRNNMITETGKIIDPLADKTLVIFIITQLYLQNLILSFYFWVIIIRDLFIFFGGIIISAKIGKVLPSNIIGKLTVLTIGVFIIITILGLETNNIFYHIFFYLSIILSFLSVIIYLIRAIEAIR